jgi:hypothetical protein
VQYLRYGLRAAAPALLLTAFLAGPASAQDPSFGSPEEQRNLIAGICTTQLPIGDAGCACLADRALVELDDAQRSYLIFSVVQPPVAERSPIARSQDQLAAIFRFLESASEACRSADAAPETPGQGADAPGEGEPE